MNRIVVIGGGIVGITCALELQNDGHQVTILDPGAVGEGASWASCGSIAVSEVIPLSKPGTLMRAPGWLLDPLGPLTLRASSVIGVLPWFLQFLRNSRMSRICRISKEISSLGLSARSDLGAFLGRYDLSRLLRSAPVIELYDTEKELEREREFHDIRRKLGFQLEEISGAAAREMEPAIAGDFACAVVMRDWRSVVDTKRFVVELHRTFVARGGEVISQKAVGFEREGARVTGVCADSGQIVKGDRFVLSAGAWSKVLAGKLGIRLNLEGVMGYQTNLTEPGVSLNHALIYAKGGFGITPYETGLAVAGSIEFARLDDAPNWKRAEILLGKAGRVLPGLQIRSAEKRMGRRPLTADTKPIIVRARAIPNLIFNTGHGQLGLTLCATSGKLVTELVAGRTPSIDVSAFSPDRF
ncbi:MAG: FAD-dependent oxidoreductase [Gammaproteobacteria bacterium]|nr:FAD-dependent oxidoreductase [Gammaproteobacteria bacterium]